MLKDMIISIKNNRIVLILFYVVTAIITIVPIVLSMFRSAVYCDSAYYICMAERISEGYIPFETLHIGYTPLFYYMMVGLKLLFHIPNGCYWPYLLFHYLLEFGVAFFVYAIAKEFGSKKSVSFFGACLSLLMIHWLQGNCVLLEVPSLFWGLMSSWLILKFKNRSSYHLLWIGIISSFSFLTKQYGLGFVVLDFLIIVAINRKSWKECLLFIMGYIVPVSVCILIWKQDFINIIFSSYGTTTAKDAGYDISIGFKIRKVWNSLWYFMYMICPAVLIGLIWLIKTWRQDNFWGLLYCYCGIVGFSLQFIFSGGFHYYMYLVPFACLVITVILSINDGKLFTGIKYLFVIFTILITLYKVYYNRVYKLYYKSDEKEKQEILTNNIKCYIDKGDKLWVVHGGLYYLLFTADVLPPNISTIGYSFGPLGLNESKAFEQAKDADFVIRFSKDYSFESFFTDSLKTYVETYPIIAISQDSAIILHKNPNKVCKTQ